MQKIKQFFKEHLKASLMVGALALVALVLGLTAWASNNHKLASLSAYAGFKSNNCADGTPNAGNGTIFAYQQFCIRSPLATEFKPGETINVRAYGTIAYYIVIGAALFPHTAGLNVDGNPVPAGSSCVVPPGGGYCDIGAALTDLSPGQHTISATVDGADVSSITITVLPPLVSGGQGIPVNTGPAFPSTLSMQPNSQTVVNSSRPLDSTLSVTSDNPSVASATIVLGSNSAIGLEVSSGSPGVATLTVLNQGLNSGLVGQIAVTVTEAVGVNASGSGAGNGRNGYCPGICLTSPADGQTFDTSSTILIIGRGAGRGSPTVYMTLRDNGRELSNETCYGSPIYNGDGGGPIGYDYGRCAIIDSVAAATLGRGSHTLSFRFNGYDALPVTITVVKADSGGGSSGGGTGGNGNPSPGATPSCHDDGVVQVCAPLSVSDGSVPITVSILGGSQASKIFINVDGANLHVCRYTATCSYTATVYLSGSHTIEATSTHPNGDSGSITVTRQ
jgi:hypothetical protein